MNKRIWRKIRKLVSEDDYDEVVKLIEQGDLYTIYEKYWDRYGKEIFEYAMDEDIKRLLKEGKFFDIYNKYGEIIYNKYLNYMRLTDIEFTTGNKLVSRLDYCMYRIKHNIIPRIIGPLLGTFIATNIGIDSVHNINVDKNYNLYKEEIEKYKNDLKNKAEEIRNMNLTDFQIVMKVFNDVYTKNIYEIPSPEYDIEGFQGLSVNEENKGVCRNFSSYTTDLLNEIKPELNARNVSVQMGDEEDFLYNIIGNHQVTAVDINGTTLIIDPTNYLIGVFFNGQIKILSNYDKDMETRPLSQVRWQGYTNMIKLLGDMAESFFPGNDLEEIEKKFGIDAQNEAIEYIKKIEEQNQEKRNIKKEQSTNTSTTNFKAGLSVKVNNYENAPVYVITQNTGVESSLEKN